MTVLAFASAFDPTPLLGKPFAWKGRGPDAYDCWGLVRECLLRAGISDCPDYLSSEHGAVNSATMLDAMMGGTWQKLTRPQPGAVVVLRMPLRGHWHCGYMLDRDRFLHTTEQTNGAVVERVSSGLWRGLVVDYRLWTPRPSRRTLACPESV